LGPVQATLLWMRPVTEGNVVSVLLSLLPGMMGQAVLSHRGPEEGETGI
jgi:hypothetical protein